MKKTSEQSDRKVSLSARNFLYPMPLAIVAANVIGRANFMALTCFSVMSYNPEIVSVVLDRRLNINDGIRAGGSFSLNFPDESLLRLLDLGSLRNGQILDDKGALDIFYGGYRKTPMISECAFNLECSLVQNMEYSNDNLYIGRIEAAYGSESSIHDGRPDLERVQPLMMYLHDGRCWKLGRCLGPVAGMEKEFGLKRF